MRRMKGQITIIGIMTLVITIAVFAMTLPLQQTWIGQASSSTNDTTTQLILAAIIPFEALMIIVSVVYYGSSVRDQVRGY